MRRSGACMTRREFIAGAAACALPLAAPAGDGDRGGAMRFGAQLYGIRGVCARDLPGALAAIRRMGYESVETGSFFGFEPAVFGGMVRAAGLELASLQLYPRHLVGKRLEETLRLCRECGARRVTSAWFEGGAANRNDWLLCAEVLNAAADAAARDGVSVGYHNHGQEFAVKFDGRFAMDLLAENLSPAVTLEFDPGWCVMAGEDAAGWLSRHVGRIRDAHLTPAIADSAGLSPGEAGLGAPRDRAAWPEIVAALRAAGARRAFVKPLSFPDSLADLEAGAAFLAASVRH